MMRRLLAFLAIAMLMLTVVGHVPVIAGLSHSSLQLTVPGDVAQAGGDEPASDLGGSVVSKNGCNASGSGCSLEAVAASSWPLAPCEGLAPPSWTIVASRLKRTSLTPDLRPPIPVS